MSKTIRDQIVINVYDDDTVGMYVNVNVTTTIYDLLLKVLSAVTETYSIPERANEDTCIGTVEVVN